MTTTANAAYPLETFGPYGPIPNGDGGYQLGDGNLKEVSLGAMSAPSTYDETASALTNLDLETGLVVYTSSSTANLALPTVAAFEAEVSSAKVGSFFDFALFPAALQFDHETGATTSLFGTEGAIAQFIPEGMEVLDPVALPLLNTLILLCSGTTVTWAHHAILEGNKRDAVRGLLLTVCLGLIFTCVQLYEYLHAPFSFRENIYSSTFFMATGFHGFHVLVGTTFLLVCLFRAMDGQFLPKQHFGFEAAAWYWHFVDVVWLFLFFCIYWWGAGKAPIALH